MTLTDATLDEIEARAKDAISKPFEVAIRADGIWLDVRNGPNGKSAAILIDPQGPITRAAVTEAIPRQNVEDQLVVNDVPALIAALRASRARERRYETALKRIATTAGCADTRRSLDWSGTATAGRSSGVAAP